MDKTIYNLELHESITANSHTEVVRVPGGWIYTTWAVDESRLSSVFVPYDNEFQLKMKEI